MEILTVVRGCSFFTLHTRPEYFVSGYETFPRGSHRVMKHFGSHSEGLWNIWHIKKILGLRNIHGNWWVHETYLVLFIKKKSNLCSARLKLGYFHPIRQIHYGFSMTSSLKSGAKTWIFRRMELATTARSLAFLLDRFLWPFWLFQDGDHMRNRSWHYLGNQSNLSGRHIDSLLIIRGGCLLQ